MIAWTGCGANNSAKPSQPPVPLAGTWAITVVQNGTTLNTLKAVLVEETSPPCTVAPGTISMQGLGGCYLADNSTGRGSVSGTGSFIYPPEGVLIGQAPFSANNPVALTIFFIEKDTIGNVAEFDANGTLTASGMSGTWTCDPMSTVCSGMSGTFSGKKVGQ
jgi:hypothetical protein